MIKLLLMWLKHRKLKSSDWIDVKTTMGCYGPSCSIWCCAKKHYYDEDGKTVFTLHKDHGFPSYGYITEYDEQGEITRWVYQNGNFILNDGGGK